MDTDHQSPGASPLRHRPRPFAHGPWARMLGELMIVVVGVVLGMQVTNWNDERRERVEVRRLLDQLRPELEANLVAFDGAERYYGVVRHYADTALAGFARDRRVSDGDFVIAAYQASQIISANLQDVSWSAIFGGSEIRRIENPDLRRALLRVLTTGTDAINLAAADTPYRRNVRRVIPESLQDRIRRQCGYRLTADLLSQTLSATCPVAIEPAQAAQVAAALRRQPDLAGDLRWHLANTATFLSNMDINRRQMRILSEQIAATAGD